MANSAEYDVIINVITGALEKARKELKGVGGAVDDVSSAQKRGSKAGKEHSETLNGGVASANNATRGFSKLKESIEGSNGLVAAYATLATNAFAVSAAFSALRNASQTAQVMEGLRVQGARLGVTLTNTAESIQEISRGSLSMADSMQAAAQASAAGFSSKNIEDLTKAAQNASIALGRNMPDSLDRMIKGTTKLEPELLDELGVMVKLTEATNKYALAHDKSAISLTSIEKRQAFLNAVLEESRIKFGGLSDEVAANPYDKLAATFSNLVTETLKWLDTNAGIRAAVGFLADNTGALVSVLVLFASTISRQLIPSLYTMSDAALKSAGALEKKISAQMRSVKASLAQAAAERELARANQLNALNMQKAPSKMQEYVKAISEGNSADKQKAAALKQINNRIYYQNSQIKKLTDTDSEQYKNRQATIDQLNEYKKTINTVTQEDLLHANTVSAAEEKAENLRKQNRGNRLQAAAQVKAANAIEIASTLNGVNAIEVARKSYGDITKSVALFKGGIDKSSSAFIANNSVLSKIPGISASAAGGLNIMRAGMFATSLAAKTLGAALLNMIPIIGNLLFIWSLLQEAFKFVKEVFFPDPAGTKELQAAVEAHNEILKSTQETAKITNRIFSDTSRGSSDITQGLGAVSGRVNEIVESFKEIERRQAAIGTDAAKQMADPTKAISIVSGKQAKQEAQIAVESLSSLRTLGYGPLVKEIDDAITTNKEFWESSGAEQAAVASRTLDKIKSKYGELGNTVKTLDENYKKISDGYNAFLNAAAIKTPFDGLVKVWDEQVVELTKFEEQLKSGAMTLEDFGKKVNSIRNDTTINFIDEKSIKQLEYIKELEAYRARQQELLDSNKLKAGVEQFRVYTSIQQVNRTITEEEGRLALFMKDAQLAAAKELVDKQKAYVFAQGELKVIQAKLQASASITSSGEEGLRYRLKLEKQSREIQIQSLQTQKAIIDAKIANSIAQLKFEQDSLDSQMQSLVLEKMRTAETAKRVAIEAGVAAESLQKGAAPIVERGAGNAGNSAQVKAQKEYLQDLALVDDAQKALSDRAIQRSAAEKALEISNREAALSSLSLQKEIEAIQQQGLSTAKTEALISQARLNRIAKEKEDQSAILEQEYAITELQRKKAVLLAGNADSFSEELRSIKEAANADRRRILNSYEAQRLRLLGEIQVAQQDLTEATGEEYKAAQETLANAERRLDVLDRSTAKTIEQKDAELALAVAGKLYVDTRKLGLELQQQSLEYMQKEVDLAGELARTRLTTAQINKEIALKSQGLYKTEEQQQAFEIEAATQAYELAVKEAALKKTLIDLEFALLDGQREVLKQQLIERKSEMLSAGYSENDTSIRQLSAALENINKAPSGAVLADRAKEQLDASIEQLGATLKNMITQGGNAEDPITKMVATIRGIQEKAAAREAAKKALQEGTKSDQLTKAVIDSGQKQINAAKIGVARSNELLEQIVTNTSKNAADSQKNMPVSSTSVMVGSIKSSDPADVMAKKVADYIATDSRVKVSEISGYGKVGKHTAGSVHGANQAFDLNVPGIGNEAADPGAKAILDQKAIEISKTGMEVLWNGVIYQMGKAIGKIKPTEDQHTDHLHAEVDSASYARMKALYASMGTAASNGARRAATELPTETQDSSPIVVTAAAKNPTLTASPISAEGTFAPVDLPPIPTQYSDTDWDGIKDKISQVSTVVDTYASKLSALGPDGEVAASVAKGAVTFASAWTNALEKMDTVGTNTAGKIQAVAQAISASIGAIQSVTAAASNAKIAGIDKEIAAEERRDGKSAASVAKLDQLEKKKDAIARKQFNLNKKLMMAQAVMSTAAAIAGQLASPPVGPWNIALAAMMGAMGLAQVAMIAGTQYESSYTAKTVSMPTSLSVGKRSDTVDLAKGPNANAGGEVSYLRGSSGTGSNASNYRTVGSAYGGELMRGYGNRGFVVGEKGPEIITPETPISVTPANDVGGAAPINANISIHALDSHGVQDILVSQKGNIIKMLREAANASGKTFMEDVNVNVYTRPSVGKL